MNNLEPTETRIATALRDLVAAIHLDATGQTCEGQYNAEIQALAEVLTDVMTFHELVYHDLVGR